MWYHPDRIDLSVFGFVAYQESPAVNDQILC